MSKTARVLALVAAIAMFCFSLWTYSRTGDWVAIVFALGSAAYGIFFFTSSSGENR
jgi:type IV secretory pathway VirB2 component (pilin)